MKKLLIDCSKPPGAPGHAELVPLSAAEVAQKNRDDSAAPQRTTMQERVDTLDPLTATTADLIRALQG